jgi:hypothetical protein
LPDPYLISIKSKNFWLDLLLTSLQENLSLAICMADFQHKDTAQILLTLDYLHNYQNKNEGQAPVAHACNPSYSGGRDQEDHGLKPVQANSSRDLILKTFHKNRAG